MSEPADQLETIFADVMTGETVPPRKRTKANCTHWDSLMQLGLVSAIEQEFGIRLSERDILDISSFDSALEIVVEKLAAKR